MPINMSISTSGILFLLKISANQCAAKIKVPNVKMSNAGSIVKFLCKDKKKTKDKRQKTKVFLNNTNKSLPVVCRKVIRSFVSFSLLLETTHYLI